jgi:hypothetical protein
MKKYIGIFVAAFLLAFGSIMFIKSSQSVNIIQTGVFEFLGPFLYLLFNHYFIEEKTFRGRLIVTTIQAGGLAIGAMTTLAIFF